MGRTVVGELPVYRRARPVRTAHPFGLAEGTETIAVHTAMVLFPSRMGSIAWVFAGVVVVIGQRVRLARQVSSTA